MSREVMFTAGRVFKIMQTNLLVRSNVSRLISISKLRMLSTTGSMEAHSTVDPADVHRLEQFTKEWWDVHGKFKALHSYNLIRVPLIRDGLVQCSSEERDAKPLEGKTILDVGCGGGILSEALARLGAKVTGIDASKDLIELAEEHSKFDPKITNNRPTYVFTTMEEHATSRFNYYDGVVASEVIEHVLNKELFLKSCVQALKPGGKLFITSPNKTRLSQVLVIFVAENILNLAPKGTHEYGKFTTPNEVTFILERNDCHVEAVHGSIYFPMINKWTWCSSQQLMYAIQAVKLKQD